MKKPGTRSTAARSKRLPPRKRPTSKSPRPSASSANPSPAAPMSSASSPRTAPDRWRAPPKPSPWLLSPRPPSPPSPPTASPTPRPPCTAPSTPKAATPTRSALRSSRSTGRCSTARRVCSPARKAGPAPPPSAAATKSPPPRHPNRSRSRSPAKSPSTLCRPGTSYEVRVFAYYLNFSRTAASPEPFETFQSAPAPKPTLTIAAPSAITDTSVHLSGTVNPNAPKPATELEGGSPDRRRDPLRLPHQLALRVHTRVPGRGR